jgi:hypothetical protein
MAVIFYWSTQANLPIDHPAIAGWLRGTQHRIAHVIAFGTVALLARWALDGLPRSAWLALVLASVFGATDEWHQSFTPGRHPAIQDWAVDTAAAGIALSVRVWLMATPLRTSIQVLAPLTVAAVFVVGVGLAVRPGLALPRDVPRPSLRAMSNQVGNTALELARSTRDLARQVRSVRS